MDHLREHLGLLPYLYSLSLNVDWTYIISLNKFLHNSQSRETLQLTHYPADIWWSLWRTYGDPCDPPSPEDYLPLVTPAPVSSPLDEITPLSLIAPIDPVPAIDASDPV